MTDRDAGADPKANARYPLETQMLLLAQCKENVALTTGITHVSLPLYRRMQYHAYQKAQLLKGHSGAFRCV